MSAKKIAAQIYEIQDPRQAEGVIELGVDRIGSVILSEQNWKMPDIREAILISKAARVKHSLIPLFNTKEVLFQAIDYYQPDIMHFCESVTDDEGHMTPCEAFVELQICVKQRFPEIEIMRSLPVGTPGGDLRIPTLEIARRFEGASDCYLIDTCVGNEPVKGFIGITGHTCDWTVARRLVGSTSVPVILAGGLSSRNVYEAVMLVKPFGADSCTGTNELDVSGRSIRFKKDYEKVKSFVQEVRRAEQDLADTNTH